MSINVADKIQIIKDNVHIIKIQNENDETLWEYVEPTITGNDVLYVANNTNQYDWDKQPEVYHLTNDSTNKIFFYKYSNFDHTESPTIGYSTFYGGEAWTDGTNTYVGHYKYNQSNNTWIYQNWLVPPYGGIHETESLRIRGDYIWTDGTDIFYLAEDGITGIQNCPAWKFNKSTNKWTKYTEIIPPSVTYYGNRIWTYNNTVYYSNGSDEQYFWNKKDQTWVKQVWSYADQLGIYYNFDFKGDELFELNGTIYAKWVRDGETTIFFLNSDGYWEPFQISPSYLLRQLMFDNTGVFTDGTNTYVTRYDDYLYKIIGTAPDNLTYEIINVKSRPELKPSLYAQDAFSLGMNTKKGDAKARPYSSTIF